MSNYFEASYKRQLGYSLRLLQLAEECTKAGYTVLFSKNTDSHVTFLNIYQESSDYQTISICSFQISQLPYRISFHMPIEPSRTNGNCVDIGELDIYTELTLKSIKPYFRPHWKQAKNSALTLKKLTSQSDLNYLQQYQIGFIDQYREKRTAIAQYGYFG